MRARQGRSHLRIARPAAGLVAVCLSTAALPARVVAGEPAGRWVSLGVLAGATLHDPGLSDYQWRTTPRAGAGAEALLGTGRARAGLRLWTTATAQTIGVPDPSSTTTVHETTLELVAGGRAAAWRGTEIVPGLSAGWLHLGFDPDRVSVPTGGGSSDVTFRPINEWVAGASLRFERTLAARWRAGLDLEHRVFALDTAHRSGSAVVQGREVFGDWSARLSLARRADLR